MLAQEMAIAAAGLGSRTEQKAWTIGEWEAVSALLPSHQARRNIRDAEVAVVPYLLRFSHADYQRLWDRWRATADAFRQAIAPGVREYPDGVVVSGKGLGRWLRNLFGARVGTE